MSVKIFTEGGASIGLGHVSRCSALYDELRDRGIKVELFIYGDIGNVTLLQGRNFRKENWLSEDFLLNHIRDSDYCIVDSYLAPKELYQIFSDNVRQSLFIDDNARLDYPSGIIVNPSLSPYHLQYEKNDNRVYLLGPEYVILRRSFRSVSRGPTNPTVKEVLVTIGGVTQDKAIEICETICAGYPDITFRFVLSANQRPVHIGNIARNVEFYSDIDADKMLTLMLGADLAISAAGQTIYELLATQTPFIPVETVANQRTNVDGLRTINNYLDVLKLGEESFLQGLKKEFVKMLEFRRRDEATSLYRNVVDGLGSQRVIDCLLSR